MAVDKQKAREACVALSKLSKEQFQEALRLLHQMVHENSEWAMTVLDIWYLGGFINDDEVLNDDD